MKKQLNFPGIPPKPALVTDHSDHAQCVRTDLVHPIDYDLMETWSEAKALKSLIPMQKDLRVFVQNCTQLTGDPEVGKYIYLFLSSLREVNSPESNTELIRSVHRLAVSYRLSPWFVALKLVAFGRMKELLK